MNTIAWRAMSSLSDHTSRQMARRAECWGLTTGRGEHLERDGAFVADIRQRVEDAAEINAAGTEVAAVVLSQMEIAEMTAAGADRLRGISFLDVHVEAVEMRVDVGGTDVGDEVEGSARPCLMKLLSYRFNASMHRLMPIVSASPASLRRTRTAL